MAAPKNTSSKSIVKVAAKPAAKKAAAKPAAKKAAAKATLTKGGNPGPKKKE